MKHTHNKTLRPLAGLALAITVGAAFVPTQRSFAQEAAATPGSSTLNTMMVTGSSIPTAEEYGPSPVDTLTTKTIERAATTDVLEILRKSSPVFSGGNNLGSSNANIAGNSTLGGSQIAIRDLPSLVLLDGRRIADSSAAAAGGLTFTDVNLIPSSLIERIEVLKDGGSAIYGSDAVGGVVNIILKKDFEGLEGGYRYGFAEKNDKEGHRISDQEAYGIFGATSEKSRVVVGLQYSETDPIYTRDRSIGVPSFGTTSYPGIILDTTVGSPLRGQAYQLNSGVTTPGAGTGLANYTAVADPTLGFDLSQATTATLEQRRFSIYSNAEYDILDNKALTAFADIIYAHNYSRSQLNAQPASVSTTSLSEDNPFNPFGSDSVNTYSVRTRFVTDPRVFETDVDFYRVVAGLKGDLFDGKLHYETAANVSENRLDYKTSNLIIDQAYNDAIANGELDPFSTAPPSADVLSQVLGDKNDTFKSGQTIYDLRLYGYPIELPAGQLGVAGGFEYIKSTLKASTGPAIFQGDVPNFPIDVSREVTAVYGEVNIPLIGGDLTYPGFYSLNANVAFRAEHYSDTGDSGVPKFGITYQPVKDVLFRATYSESYLAPTLFDLFGPSGSGFTDPISLPGFQDEQAQQISGSNPDLDPATSTNWGVGVVITPRWVPSLTVSFDYFNIDYKDVVGTVGAQTIAQSVQALGTASPYYQFVHVGSPNGPGVTGPNQLGGALSDTFIDVNNQNLGGNKIEGFDWAANYRLDLASAGALTLGAQGVYYLKYLQQDLPTDPWTDIKGTDFGTSIGQSYLPQWKVTSFIDYEWQGITWSLSFNYAPETINANSTSIVDYPLVAGSLPKIDEYYTFDTFISYEFGKNKTYEPTTTTSYSKDGKEVVSNTTQIAPKKSLLDGLKLKVGVNNLFDQDPPFVEGGQDNTDLAAFDLYGRYYYFEVSKKF